MLEAQQPVSSENSNEDTLVDLAGMGNHQSEEKIGYEPEYEIHRQPEEPEYSIAHEFGRPSEQPGTSYQDQFSESLGKFNESLSKNSPNQQQQPEMKKKR